MAKACPAPYSECLPNPGSARGVQADIDGSGSACDIRWKSAWLETVPRLCAHSCAAASAIHPKGAAILVPGGLLAAPVSAISLGLALVFGTAGLPHIPMRFFKDAAAARRSGFYPTACVAYFCLVIPRPEFGRSRS